MRESKHYKVVLNPLKWGHKYCVLQDIDNPLTLVEELHRKMNRFGFSVREIMEITEYEKKE